MANLGENKNVDLLKTVEERALSKKVEDEQKQQNIPHFHKDFISDILIRLPLEALQSSRFVCKMWYSVINSPVFIDDHLRHSESMLISLKSVQNERLYPYAGTSIPTQQPNYFSVESSLSRSEPLHMFEQPIARFPKFCIHFLEFKEGENTEVREYNVSCRGFIRAACNGLILLDNKLKKGGLIVMNPVTRKLKDLPIGTIYPPQDESYALALSNTTGEYKVVHLFRDELGYVSCEVLNLQSRFWKEVNGPSFGLFSWFGYEPVLAIGAIHWVPHIDHNDYIVSVEVDNEKFHTVQLPRSCRTYDRIIEIESLLCFAVHEDLKMDIWSLKSVTEGTWTRQYSISRGIVIDMVPMLSLRIRGDLILKRDEDGSFYAYDFRFQKMRKVEMDGKFYGTCLPHVNSLVSWMPTEKCV